MLFHIMDCNHIPAPIIVCDINSNNGKNALKTFYRNHAMSSGLYEIHKRCNRWILSTTYGAYFVALPANKIEQMEVYNI